MERTTHKSTVTAVDSGKADNHQEIHQDSLNANVKQIIAHEQGTPIDVIAGKPIILTLNGEAASFASIEQADLNATLKQVLAFVGNPLDAQSISLDVEEDEELSLSASSNLSIDKYIQDASLALIDTAQITVEPISRDLQSHLIDDDAVKRLDDDQNTNQITPRLLGLGTEVNLATAPSLGPILNLSLNEQEADIIPNTAQPISNNPSPADPTPSTPAPGNPGGPIETSPVDPGPSVPAPSNPGGPIETSPVEPGPSIPAPSNPGGPIETSPVEPTPSTPAPSNPAHPETPVETSPAEPGPSTPAPSNPGGPIETAPEEKVDTVKDKLADGREETPDKVLEPTKEIAAEKPAEGKEAEQIDKKAVIDLTDNAQDEAEDHGNIHLGDVLPENEAVPLPEETASQDKALIDVQNVQAPLEVSDPMPTAMPMNDPLKHVVDMGSVGMDL